MNLIRKKTALKPLYLTKSLAKIMGLGAAVPPFSATQGEILKFVLSQFKIKENTKKLYQKTFSNPSIQKRHFALSSLDSVLETDHQRISERFQAAAADLSLKSFSLALQNAHLSASDIDFVITTTCTGYLCPGISSYLIEHAKLRNDVHTADLTGMGCGAALPALEQAVHFVESHPGTTAAVVCTEICSAALYSNNDPDIVISNTLFSDGSACVLLRSDAPETRFSSNGKRTPVVRTFSSLTIPEWRDALRFQNEGGYLKNVLGKDVPQQSAEAVSRVIADLLEKSELRYSDISHWVMHSGGEKIINAIEQKLNLSPDRLQASRIILREFGNMSSPSVLFVLGEENKLNPPKAGDFGVISSFGAGFSAYAALLEY